MCDRVRSRAFGKRIDRVEVLRDPGGRYAGAKGIEDSLVTEVYRRGKLLLIETTEGYLRCHNAMSGYWDTDKDPWTFDYVEGKRTAKEGDVRTKIFLEDGTVLRFHDARMFGSLKTITRDQLDKETAKMGPDALSTPSLLGGSPTFNVLDSAMFLSDDRPVKEMLLDQTRIAGVGNIYAAEALWRARLSPHRSGLGLLGDDHQALAESIDEVLKAALDRSLDYEGLQIYRRKSCPRCGTAVSREKMKGRTTHWCTQCQR